MRFDFPCRHCGHKNSADLTQAGTTLACGGCRKPLKVPAPAEPAAGAAAAPAEVVRFACPACGRKFSTKPDLIGKKIRCSGCGGGVRVPDPNAPAAPTPAARPAAKSRPALQTFGSGPASPAPAPAARREPARPAPPAASGAEGLEIDPDDDDLPLQLADEPAPLAARSGAGPRPRGEAGDAVLPSRSAAMEEVRKNVAEKEAAAAQAVKKKKKKKKKGSGYFETKDVLQLVGGVLAVVAVLGGLAYAYPDFRFPVGGVLVVVGFIVYLMGWAALRQMAAEEGGLQALLFRFFPPYQWWFVISRWAEARDYVAFFGAGLVVMAMGGVIMKSSPVGKRAAEADRKLEARENPGEDDSPFVEVPVGDE